MGLENGRRERVTLAQLPSGDTLSTTVHQYEGEEDGPTVYIQAALHGDEINGVEVIRRICESIDPAEMAGRLVVVPVANPDAFDRGVSRRGDPVDTVNPAVNRIWPGDPNGSPYEQLTARLWEYASEADAIVDLHAMERYVVPYVLTGEQPEAVGLAEAFGTEMISHLKGEGLWEGMLSEYATEHGIPSITAELGHSEEIQEDAAEVGATGVENVLRYVGVLPGEPVENGTPERRYENHVWATESGLFRRNPDVAIGDEIARGDEIGFVYDPATLEVQQVVEADEDGLLFHAKGRSMIQRGKALAIIGVENPETAVETGTPG